jgi:transcription initiation factor TFIID subunit 7
MSESERPKLRLSLNLGSSSKVPSASSPPAQTPGGTILSFKKLTAPSPASSTTPASAMPPPKTKRQYNKKNKAATGEPAATKPAKAAGSKKRKNEDDGNEPAVPTKKAKASVGRPPLQQPQRSMSLSLKLNKPLPQAQSIPRRIQLKHKGQPPKRELGVGWDSEAEDAEIDPAIEAQFILRMQPGEDCDALRQAIEEKKIGDSFSVALKFWDREGRRAAVRIRDTWYAAILVDLPCIIEGMKSWDKKGWYKSADICQLLWVLGKADSEEGTKTYPLPEEVAKAYENPLGLYQFPHGLTPPMHYVRKRRFRKRVNYRTIERVENEVERLLKEDEDAQKGGGKTEYDLINPEDMVDEEVEYDDGEDGEGEIDYDQEGVAGDGEGDEEDLMDMMMEELGDENPNALNQAALQKLNSDVQHILPSTETVETPIVDSPSAFFEETDADNADHEDEDDEDEDDQEDENSEIDEEELVKQREEAELRDQIEDLKKEVEAARQQYDQQKNPLLKKRAGQKLENLRKDLEIKQAQMGLEGSDAE